MMQWHSLIVETIDCSRFSRPAIQELKFDVPHEAQIIRIICSVLSPAQTLTEEMEPPFEEYLNHPTINEKQKESAQSSAAEIFEYKKSRWGAIHLFDSKQNFRGRWDPSFHDWKYLSSDDSSNGFVAGKPIPGQWTALLIVSENIHKPFEIKFQAEWSPEKHEKTIKLSIANRIPKQIPEETRWYIGELHEHTSRSVGALAVETTIHQYEALGYQFLALTDHDLPPLEHPAAQLEIITGQEIETFYGHATLLGNRKQIHWHRNGIPKPLSDIILETHESGGLFCIAHPFSLLHNNNVTAWHSSEMEWQYVDLLEIWSGCWKERFPEILKTLDCWDSLLNQGYKIIGVSGKGAKGGICQELVEQLPKLLVFADSTAETDILSALKQGRCYATVEPAVNFWLESAHGGAMIGDELRLPAGEACLLRLEISCINPGGFLRMKTNEGVYCEMPLSSVRDTQLKLIEKASPGIRWFRLEIYRYGRPLDELLAFTNPVFIRGITSVRPLK